MKRRPRQSASTSPEIVAGQRIALLVAIAAGTLSAGVVVYVGARFFGPNGLDPVQVGSGTTLDIIRFTGLTAVVVAGVVFFGARWIFALVSGRK